MKYKRPKPYSIASQRGEFCLLYPYGDINTPYDSAVYVTYREAASSSGRKGARLDETCLTWAEKSKGRLFTEKNLHNSGTLLQQWMLRKHKNIGDLRHHYQKKETDKNG